MAETTVIIEGGATNKSFVLDLLDQPEVIDGRAVGRHRLDRPGPRRGPAGRPRSTPAIALAAAAIEAYEDELGSRSPGCSTTAHGGRPQVQHEAAGRSTSSCAARATGCHGHTGPPRFRVSVASGGTSRPWTSSWSGSTSTPAGSWSAGSRFRLVTATHGPSHLVEVDGVTHRVSRDEGGVLRSPAPALVVATPLAVGDEVEAGAPVLVLESMKMETVLRAPFKARVRECR